MRTLRIALVGPVILTLLAGFGASVVAQADEQMPTSATGTLEFVEPVPEAVIGDGSDGATHAEPTAHVHHWTSSDPRLTGIAAYTGTWHLYDPPAEDCDDPDAEAGVIYEIVTDDGGWICGGVRAPIPGPDGATNVHTIVFSGTGANEGLSAYILVDWSTSPYTFSALITPNAVPIVPVMHG